MTDFQVIRGTGGAAPPKAPTFAATDPRLIVFLEALPKADADDLCSPPGLGGLWRVRHIRTGLERQILVVHHSGKGLAYGPFPAGHRKHPCPCTMCHWEKQAEERGNSTITREQAAKVQQEVLHLQFGQQRSRVSALDADL